MFKMKKNYAVLLVTASIIGGTIYSVSGANAEPGSSADPVVTKGYVDEKISELMDILGEKTGTNESAMSSADKEEIISSVLKELSKDSDNSDSSNEDTNSSMYTPVNAKKGQVILGGEGTEIILRSGQAVGYVEGVDGIVNATTGTEVGNKTKVSKNNILIVPRDDGRGVKITTDEAWFIIKGSYQIVG
ncbi:MAG: hypothetical protein IAC55_05420 [Tyzzerella sp.]|uniref:Uncharacterized protein n=1 Tax=Candidatus Fimicola merdigallinarum TaxID=2840819 RepID=A0A9D9E0I1_9FIRM|nr:hypothetical protein [Candidatus Fimicola merdigallinarum]